MSRKKHYFPLTIFPCYIGAIFSEAEWKKELKFLKIKEEYAFVEKTAAMQHITNPKKDHIFLICIDLAASRKRYKRNALISVIAHEVSHVVDAVFEQAGETNPSPETKAYLTQWVMLHTLNAMDDWKPSK